MKPEEPSDDQASRPAGADRATGEEVGVLLDAVDRDVAAGIPVRDAMRDRCGLVFPGPVPETERVPVDLNLIRAYTEGTLPAEERARVCRLIWGDIRWGVAYVKMTLKNTPGSRPELLDRLLTEQKPEPRDGSAQ